MYAPHVTSPHAWWSLSRTHRIAYRPRPPPYDACVPKFGTHRPFGEAALRAPPPSPAAQTRAGTRKIICGKLVDFSVLTCERAFQVIGTASTALLLRSRAHRRDGIGGQHTAWPRRADRVARPLRHCTERCVAFFSLPKSGTKVVFFSQMLLLL